MQLKTIVSQGLIDPHNIWIRNLFADLHQGIKKAFVYLSLIEHSKFKLSHIFDLGRRIPLLRGRKKTIDFYELEFSVTQKYIKKTTTGIQKINWSYTRNGSIHLQNKRSTINHALLSAFDHSSYPRVNSLMLIVAQ